jgi:hypothetical protein
MGAALPSLCVLEWSSPDNITYRLAGSSHADAAGRELKGESLIELMAPGDRQVAIERARIITSRPCGGLSTGQAVRPSGYKTPFRNLTLPVLPRSPHELHRAYIALDTYGDPVGPVEEPISKISLGDDHSYIDIGYGASA